MDRTKIGQVSSQCLTSSVSDFEVENVTMLRKKSTYLLLNAICFNICVQVQNKFTNTRFFACFLSIYITLHVVYTTYENMCM